MAKKAILLICLIGLVFIALIAAVFVWWPPRIAASARIQDQANYLTFLAATRASTAALLGEALSSLTALTAIGTVYATYRTYLSMQDKQLADTLAKATELLGSAEAPTRLGGVFVLRRLARLSFEDYFVTVQILSGHLKARQSSQNLSDKNSAPVLESECPPDVQAIMTTLGERPWAGSPSNGTIDLSSIHLSRTNLANLNFRSVSFRGSQFYSVDFSNSDLSHADLSGCYLSGCQFDNAKLTETCLIGARFHEAASLTQPQIDHSRGDDTTLLPGALRYPDSWTRNESATVSD
jgi:hypothetical protein